MGSILEVNSQLSIGGLTADFIGKVNIWINDTYNPSVIKLARHILCEAIFKTAPSQLSILAYDGELSGVFSPFAALSTGESRILKFVTDEKQLMSELMSLKQQIQAVQNVIQGRNDSLIEFRESVQRAVEGYKLVVLYMDVGLISQELLTQLSLLMRSGPSFGISFLIISTTYMVFQVASGRLIERKVESIAPNITVLEPGTNKVSAEDGKTAPYVPYNVEMIIQDCESFVEKIRTAQLETVHFTELHDMNRIWTENSVDGLTFCIGKHGINNMEITIGDEFNQRHNAIITGAVGQGKSNLISVIIHSLCMRYSPKELQLYLLDFKEGVTFKAFSNIGQEDYLPHARTLGLESDVSFGLAVLNSLFNEYQSRMKLLKEKNAKSIRDLRSSFPEIQIPRIVVVIDEFQMMFGDDNYTGQKIADMLEKSVRLFRAAGIHFILASQTLVGNMALSHNKDSIFSQIPIRIALKNSESEARAVLAMDNAAAAYVRPRESVVNLDYGELSQNRKTVIAFADEKILRPIRRQMWELAKDYTMPPFVFESERRITVSSGLQTLEQFRHTAKVPMALIGDRISIDGERIALPMSHEPGRNIAILGTPDGDCNQAVGILQSVAVSLAAQHPEGDARFLFCDFDGENQAYERKYSQFVSLMEFLGFFIEIIPREQFADTIKELMEQPVGSDTIYLFGSMMDRWEYVEDSFGQDTPLKALVEGGPARRIHFVGWWVKSSKFNTQVIGYGNSDAFNSKIFLRMDERAIQSLTNPFVRWSAQTNRGLIIDDVEFSEEVVFIPYAPVNAQDVTAFRKGL